MTQLTRFIRCGRAVQRAAILLLAAAGLVAAGAQAQSDNAGPGHCDQFARYSVEGVEKAPTLTGGTLAEARDRLRDYELDVEVVEVASDEPSGQVVNQWPKPGEGMGLRTLVLCVSRGPAADWAMPSLIGLTLEQARRLLAAREILGEPEIRRGPHASVARERIFRQAPEAGASVIDSPIVLDVSDGPPPVLMPSVTNMTVDQARRALAARRIPNAPVVRRATHATVARDRIYGQAPAANAPVAATDRIVLDVSDGPPAVRMPSLANMTVPEAHRALAALEIFNPRSLRGSPHATVARDRIFGQSPAAGTPVTADVSIVLEVSEGPLAPPSTAPSWVVVPRLERMPEAAAVARLERDGLVAVAEGARHSAYAAGQVIETRPAAGERVERGETIYYALSLGPAEPDPQPGGNRRLLLALLAAAALAAAALAAKLVRPLLLKPRFEVGLAGPPVPGVEWGEPPGLEFEVSAEPPAHACRIDPPEPPGSAKEE